MFAEADIIEMLEQQRVTFPPLTLRVYERNARIDPDSIDNTGTIDVILEADWEGQSWMFAVEVCRLSTPKAMRDSVTRIQIAAEQACYFPMVIVPYLSDANVAMLEQAQVSGVDLCGNGYVFVPGHVLISRTGRPNQFPQSAPIRNIYRGDSSLVVRAFLAQPEYRSVNEIEKVIQQRGGKVALSTVSKVLKVLEGELIVGREGRTIRLLQPGQLLDHLAVHYRDPKIKERYQTKIALSEGELRLAIAIAAKDAGAKLVMTGASSAEKYATQSEVKTIVSAYCNIAPKLLVSALPTLPESSAELPNLDLIWTTDGTVYFDAFSDGDVSYASPVQTYLELVSAGPSQSQLAVLIRDNLIQKGGDGA